MSMQILTIGIAKSVMKVMEISMPNWCYNTLRISGKPKDLHKFVKQVKDDNQVFSFEKIIPMPESEKDNWYEWRVANWNTKWNADCQDDNFKYWESGDIYIDFNTAWSMPTPILLEVSKQNPKLYFEFRCYEESYAFWQVGIIQKGKFLSESGGSFESCDEFNEFGLTHHNCKTCDEWLHEWCDNSNEQQIEMCDDCQATKEKQDTELQELDKELWGEQDETTEKENAV